MPEWLTIVATVSLALAVLCWLGLPMTIGLMAVSLTFSLLVLALGKAGFSIETEAEQFVQKIDFNEAVLHGLLAFFLFAGALRVKLDECSRWVVATFAFMGTVLSAALIGLISYAVFTWLDLGLSLLHCLLFGH